MALWVYILECADGTLYTGVTNNIERRLWEHQSGLSLKAYTYKRRPVILKYAKSHSHYLTAIAWEKRIKRWSANKKWALITKNWDELKRLSVCRNESRWDYGSD